MIDTNDMDGLPLAIAARSKRQAMDWSLVLASQDIAAIINRTETGWELLVDRPDYERARAALNQYHLENRGWRWRGQLPGTAVVFHWGSALWALGMAGFYYWTMVAFPWLQRAGAVDTDAVSKGQWWRLFTAVTLHENLPHLLSNEAMGFLLLGLAMARYGPGVATLAAFLAGVIGNCASVLMGPAPHTSLGASGMVTGALGLITVQPFALWRNGGAASWFPRAVAGGVLILVLIGFSPGADMVAHVGGFVAGIIFALPLAWVRPAALQRRAPNLICGIVLTVLLTVTWRLACGR
jgi:membrane associated rhomboid family serine protease